MADEPSLRWVSAVASQSNRLALYTAANLGFVDQTSIYRTGGYHRGRKPQVLAVNVSAEPILYYASNFNGGIPGDTIRLSWGELTPDEESRAKSGIAAGFSVSAGVLASYRRGSVFRVSMTNSSEWLLKHDLRRQQVAIGGCFEHLLAGYTWVDGCASTTRVWRNYDSDIKQHSLSLRPTFLMTIGGLDQQIGIRGKRTFYEEGPQNGLTVDWMLALPEFGTISLGAAVAEKLEGENTDLREASAGAATIIADRLVQVGMSYSETGGYRIDGGERQDHVLSASLALPLNDKFSLSASAGRRNSSIDGYDETFGRINIEVLGW